MTYHRMGQLLSLLCCLWGEYHSACARADRARGVRVFGLIDIVNSRLLRACEEEP